MNKIVLQLLYALEQFNLPLTLSLQRKHDPNSPHYLLLRAFYNHAVAHDAEMKGQQAFLSSLATDFENAVNLRFDHFTSNRLDQFYRDVKTSPVVSTLLSLEEEIFGPYQAMIMRIKASQPKVVATPEPPKEKDPLEAVNEEMTKETLWYEKD